MLLRLYFITLIVFVSACGPVHTGTVELQDKNGTASVITAEMKTYKFIYTNIIVKQCLDCHKPGQNAPILGTKEGLPTPETYKFLFDGNQITTGDASRSRLYTVITSGRMPKNPNKYRVSKQELDTIAAWINEGAKPESALVVEPPPIDLPLPPPPIKVINYERIKSEVTGVCNGCHYTDNFVISELDEYAKLVQLVVPKDPANSKLIKWVTRTDKFRMPWVEKNGEQMSGDPLTAEQIQLLTDWINLGAPEQ